MAAGARRLHHQLAGHARDRLLARAVDVGDDRLIGGEQRAAELLGLIARARVEVRLEHGVDAPVAEAPGAPPASVASTSVGWCA